MRPPTRAPGKGATSGSARKPPLLSSSAISACSSSACAGSSARIAARRRARSSAQFDDRAHFFAYAATAMRSVVVDYARQRMAQKRGGDLHRVTDLPEELAGGMRVDEEMLGLDTALNRLADVDKRLAQVVEMRYFAGLSEAEIAAVLNRSERSIRRDWQKARMFLLAALQG